MSKANLTSPARREGGCGQVRQVTTRGGSLDATKAAYVSMVGALAPLRVPQSLGTTCPDRLAGGPHHQITVLGLNTLVGRVLAVARALAGRLLVVGEPLRRGPRAKADRGLQ